MYTKSTPAAAVALHNYIYLFSKQGSQLCCLCHKATPVQAAAFISTCASYFVAKFNRVVHMCKIISNSRPGRSANASKLLTAVLSAQLQVTVFTSCGIPSQSFCIKRKWVKPLFHQPNGAFRFLH